MFKGAWKGLEFRYRKGWAYCIFVAKFHYGSCRYSKSSSFQGLFYTRTSVLIQSLVNFAEKTRDYAHVYPECRTDEL